jgi:cobalt-zinc-cadmium efflux system membrane fusion protein
MGVKVVFESGSQQASTKQVSVPRAALRRDGERDIVFVLDNGKAERRAVVVASSEGERAQITSGVNGGEQVITTSDKQLSDGQRVKVSEQPSGGKQ